MTMQQSHYKSNYELKSLARVQTSQHMGILAGSLLLKLLISFMSVNLITALIPTRTTTGYIVLPSESFWPLLPFMGMH